MILYHGTDKFAAKQIIDFGVNLKIGRENLDFGQGFYTTPDYRQAWDWAKRRSVFPYVIEFDLNDTGLSIKRFVSPDMEWAQFVVENRLGMIKVSSYDCILGPMADSRIATLYLDYKQGLITKDEAVKNLIGKTNGIQLVVLKDNALNMLRFVRGYEHE